MKIMSSAILCTLFGFGCAQPTISPHIKDALSRSDFSFWDEYRSTHLDVQFEKPTGRQNIQEGGQALVMYLHGVSAATAFPSDPQYLITMAFKRVSKDEWINDQMSQARLSEKITDPFWRTFRLWAHSMHEQVSMKEMDMRRYYRRTLLAPNGDVVSISAEYTPTDSTVIAEDDAAIRRIMSSVRLIPKE